MRNYIMAKIKDMIIDVLELYESGLDFDKIVDCTDYPADMVRQILQQVGEYNDPIEEVQFDDVPF
jgi:hypothetical protein